MSQYCCIADMNGSGHSEGCPNLEAYKVMEENKAAPKQRSLYSKHYAARKQRAEARRKRRAAKKGV